MAHWKGRIDKEFQYAANKALNEGSFIDFFGSLPVLLLWVKSCSFFAMKEAIHSASFPICQSSGMGKTKLVAQLCRKENGPNDCFWVVNIVCRNAQNMEQSPFVSRLHVALSECPSTLLPSKTSLPTVQLSADLEKQLSAAELKDECLVQSLIPHVKAVVAQLLQAIIYHQNGNDISKNPADWNSEHHAKRPRIESDDGVGRSSSDKDTSEESFYRLFHYVQDDKELECQKEMFDWISKYPITNDICGLFQQLHNRKVVFVWDEARGLFPNDKFDDQQSQLFRAVRRSSTEIAKELNSMECPPTFCFIFMDTSARVTNFLKPRHIDPSQLKMRFSPERYLPPMPVLPFVCTHDTYAHTLLIQGLTSPEPILRLRLKNAFSPKALNLFCGIGRPLWQNTRNLVDDIEKIVLVVAERLHPSRSNPPFFLPILAARAPINIPSRCIEAADLVANSPSTLKLLSPDNMLVTSDFHPEPSVAAACASLMQNFKCGVFEDFSKYLGSFGPEAGLGGEFVAMLMALSATDTMTGYKPYFACGFSSWIKKFLGNPKVRPPR